MKILATLSGADPEKENKVGDHVSVASAVYPTLIVIRNANSEKMSFVLFFTGGQKAI